MSSPYVDKKIVLRVQNSIGEQTRYLIAANRKLVRIFSKYSLLHGGVAFAFFFAGQPVADDATAESLKLSENDVIDAVAPIGFVFKKPSIELLVREPSGTLSCFSLRPSSKLERPFLTFSKIKEGKTFEFFFSGRPVLGRDTAELLGLKDGRELEVVKPERQPAPHAVDELLPAEPVAKAAPIEPEAEAEEPLPPPPPAEPEPEFAELPDAVLPFLPPLSLQRPQARRRCTRLLKAYYGGAGAGGYGCFGDEKRQDELRRSASGSTKRECRNFLAEYKKELEPLHFMLRDMKSDVELSASNRELIENRLHALAASTKISDIPGARARILRNLATFNSAFATAGALHTFYFD